MAPPTNAAGHHEHVAQPQSGKEADSCDQCETRQHDPAFISCGCSSIGTGGTDCPASVNHALTGQMQHWPGARDGHWYQAQSGPWT